MDKDKNSIIESDESIRDKGTNAFGQEYPSGINLYIPLVSIILCLFLAALDIMIVTTVIEDVARQFSAYSKVGWLFTGYSLPNALLVLVWGRVATLVGFKTSMLTAIIIFEIGSLVSALANSMDMLIGGRVIAGVGGSGIQSLVFVIASTIVEERKVGMIVAILGSAFGISSVVGPFLGGAFTSHVTWRWCFYINLPIGGLAFFLFLCFYDPYKSNEQQGKSIFRKLGYQAKHFFTALWSQLCRLRMGSTWKLMVKELLFRFDFIEFAFMTTGSVLILLAFTFGGNHFAWNSGSTIAMFVLGILFTIFALVYDFAIFPRLSVVQHVPHYQPLISWRTFKVPGIFLFNVSVFFVCCAYGIQVTYIIQYFQLIYNESAWKASVHLIACVVPTVITVISSGMCNSKTGYVKPIAIFSGVTGIVGAGILTLLNNHASSAKHIGLLILPGVAFGAILQCSVIGVQILLDKKSPTYKHDFVSVTTLNVFVKNLGNAYGAVLGDTVFSVSALNLIRKRKVAMPGGYPTTANYLVIAREQFFDGPRSPIGDIISKSIVNCFYMALGMFAIVLVSVLFLSNKKVDIRKDTEDIEKQYESE
ncbi:hypothetical protein RNJ44_04982 [Nakaseomyces bracarensis]|uniref:Major facilitator superfamily (MFS) profile domain-containing protein n=1 Tax=Nakaseomyces bracarensis TaxID=273131 RepID=A0ABR4NWF5_9SACH